MTMTNIVHIGVTLVQGCDIKGGEKAMEVLSQRIPLESMLSISEELLQKEEPLYLNAIADLNRRLKKEIKQKTQNGEFPIVFGGDHAMAIGSMAANCNHDSAILWIDAHGDCNTDETSITQRIHGMPLAVAQGYGHPELISIMDDFVLSQNVLTLGIRSLDPLEETLMRKWGVQIITLEEIREKGIMWCIDQVQTFMDTHSKVHCSYDCDSMDPKLIPGVNTPVDLGFNQTEILELLKVVFESKSLKSLDIVEFNPELDNGNTLNLIDQIQQLLHTSKED